MCALTPEIAEDGDVSRDARRKKETTKQRRLPRCSFASSEALDAAPFGEGAEEEGYDGMCVCVFVCVCVCVCVCV